MELSRNYGIVKEYYENNDDIEKSYHEGYASYRLMTELCFTDMILCNNIADIDSSIYDNMVFEKEDDEDWEFPEIYQWYLVDVNSAWFDDYKDTFIMSYSDLLDCYVLCVDHFGTGWNYVNTNVKLVD